MGVGDHLVLVARHQPLQRVPDNQELQVIFINQLQLFPVLIKTVKSVEWIAVQCSACIHIYNDNFPVRGSISDDRASGIRLLVRLLC